MKNKWQMLRFLFVLCSYYLVKLFIYHYQHYNFILLISLFNHDQIGVVRFVSFFLVVVGCCCLCVYVLLFFSVSYAAVVLVRWCYNISSTPGLSTDSPNQFNCSHRPINKTRPTLFYDFLLMVLFYIILASSSVSTIILP